MKFISLCFFVFKSYIAEIFMYNSLHMNRLVSTLHSRFENTSVVLKNSVVERVLFYQSDNKVEVTLHTTQILPFQDYSTFIYGLEELLNTTISLVIHVDSSDFNTTDIKQYLSFLGRQHAEYRDLTDTVFTYDKQNHTVSFLLGNQQDVERYSAYCHDVEQDLARCGFIVHLQCITNTPTIEEVGEVMMQIKPKEETPISKAEHKKPSYKRLKLEEYTRVNLKDMHDPISDIQFEGEIFQEEKTITKNDRMIQSMAIYDGTDAMLMKRFEGRGVTREVLSSYKAGDRVKVYGSIQYDNFAKDLVIMPQEIEVLDKKVNQDDAEKKRVEFHMHTNMSEMDGVCDVNRVVKYAFDIGHRGIVISDHADVQSFVKAYNTGKSLAKSDPDRHFRVGFGCEMNMVDEYLCIVRNGTDEKIESPTYISFDLETTGLSAYYDHIIEFGAVKIKNQTEIDRLQMFIKPPVPIPPFISHKTNITNEMVKNAKSFAECIDEILEWIGDGILVAHNASFDYFFINEELRRIGKKPLQNTVIDTLDLSRAILKNRRAYRLGNIARNYHVAYDEEVAHRADYDAESLSGVFLCLLKDAKEKFGCVTIQDLQDKTQDAEAFKKVRRSHVCAIVKNQAGMKDLYKLVTISNTKTLAVMGKASGKEGTDVAAEARITRKDIQMHRANLLIGSACLNGELFELACNGEDARLLEAMKFYDYIELQPLGNYSTAIALGSLPNIARLKDVQKRMIACAKQLGIPVIADSDAHYCVKEEKIFRDVYIMSQGVGGSTHPLYIRDDELRMRTKNPDQHFRLTNEMMQEFSWLDDPNLVQEIVIDNPNALFDSIDENIMPVPSGTYPPHIEASGDKLRAICMKTAKNMYAYDGVIPSEVLDRLEFELDNIITNGFDVHYYIAHLLVKKSNKDGYVVGSRGSVGSSFTATMSGITEVNPLKPHYLCPHCHHSEWIDDPDVKSGFDLQAKPCPKCGTMMKGDGQNIPFQTFLGFNADKVPDIDLNFSNEYQWRAHEFIKEVFGANHAFRAGTIGTVADKTAYGYVQGYCEKMHREDMRRAMKEYLAKGCTNVKRTTGQHPGGIIIIPDEYEAEDFTPVQYPANDPTAAWLTTHYDFHDIHDNVLKFDILGHVDPTAIRMLQRIGTVKPLDIPMNDPDTISLFYSDDALQADPRIYKKENGALGLPEFGTKITRRVLEETKPSSFAELVMISGLTHGTDVWAGNAQSLVQAGHPLNEVIACRDDIMTYLLDKNLKPLDAFKIMESVRKGKGLTAEWEADMKEHNVPDWYIESCKKIKYMFPKAHAVAYVMMAVRIAWYKVHEPRNFYIQFFTHRCDAYELDTMCKGIEAIRVRMKDIQDRLADRNTLNPVSNKEKALFDTLEVCEELYARGYRISNVDLYKSHASEFIADSEDEKTIIPPFTVIDGLGGNVAKSIEIARNEAEFLSKEDLEKRTQLSSTLIKKLDAIGVLEGLQELNQLSLF